MRDMIKIKFKSESRTLFVSRRVMDLLPTNEDDLLWEFSLVESDDDYRRLLFKAIAQKNPVAVRLLVDAYKCQPKFSDLVFASRSECEEIERFVFERLGSYLLRGIRSDDSDELFRLIKSCRVGTLREINRRGYFRSWDTSDRVWFVKKLIQDAATRDAGQFEMVDLFLLEFQFPWLSTQSFISESVFGVVTDRVVFDHLYGILLPRKQKELDDWAFHRAADLGFVDFCIAHAKKVDRECSLTWSLVGAVKSSRWEVATALLHSVVPPITDKDEYWTIVAGICCVYNAMDTAIDAKSLRGMELLLEYGYCRSTRRYVARCIEQSYFDGLRLLFARGGANMDPGYLLDACAKERVLLVRTLLEIGADPDATTFWGKVFFRYPRTVSRDNRAIQRLFEEHRESA